MAVRILTALAILLLATANVFAGPQQLRAVDPDLIRQDTPRLVMPGEVNYPRAAGTADTRLMLGPQPEEPEAAGLSLGPVRAEGETINGHRRIHYNVDGGTLMGGEVGASMSGHGAMLTLHWQSSDH